MSSYKAYVVNGVHEKLVEAQRRVPYLLAGISHITEMQLLKYRLDAFIFA